MNNEPALEEKLKNLRALILDMDGVLVDTEPLHKQSFAMLMDESGMDYDEDFLNALVGNSVDENIETILKKHTRFSKENQVTSLQRREAIYLDLLKQTDLQAVTGIDTILEICKQNNIELALASSSIHEQIDAILEALGIAGQFKFIVSGQDVAAKKPAPDIYLKTVRELNVDKKHCLAVEDSPAGVASARQAGIECIGITNLFANAESLKQASWLADSMQEFANIMQQTLGNI